MAIGLVSRKVEACGLWMPRQAGRRAREPPPARSAKHTRAADVLACQIDGPLGRQPLQPAGDRQAAGGSRLDPAAAKGIAAADNRRAVAQRDHRLLEWLHRKGEFPALE